jgi:NitT/TauT family transport system ATP-binding protein
MSLTTSTASTVAAAVSRVSFENVSKIYRGAQGDVHVVDDASFALGEGDFVSLIGPSGCGKTTMLQMLAGFVTPDSGRVLLNGQPVAGPDSDRGVIFQEYGVFPWLTVEKNIEFGLTLGRNLRPIEERRRIVAHYVKLMHLNGFEKAYPKHLSGGMRQRLALARAYAVNPNILLMDEPFGALDAQTRLALQLQLMEVLTAERKTVLLITHSVEEAIFLSTRILMISARPSRVLRTIDVPFAYPRTPELTATPEFQKLRLELEQMSMQQYAAQQRLAAESH